MPKICELSNFTGGQINGFDYFLDLRMTQLSLGDVSYYSSYNPNTGSGNSPIFQASILKVTGIAGGVEILASRKPYSTGAIQISANIWRYVIAVGFPSQLVTIQSATFYKSGGGFDTGGGSPRGNCRCSDDSCRVDCASEQDGFCCIEHSFTNQLLQFLNA